MTSNKHGEEDDADDDAASDADSHDRVHGHGHGHDSAASSSGGYAPIRVPAASTSSSFNKGGTVTRGDESTRQLLTSVSAPLEEKRRKLRKYRALYTYEGVIGEIRKLFAEWAAGVGSSNRTTFLRCEDKLPPHRIGYNSGSEIGLTTAVEQQY